MDYIVFPKQEKPTDMAVAKKGWVWGMCSYVRSSPLELGIVGTVGRRRRGGSFCLSV